MGTPFINHRSDGDGIPKASQLTVTSSPTVVLTFSGPSDGSTNTGMAERNKLYQHESRGMACAQSSSSVSSTIRVYVR